MTQELRNILLGAFVVALGAVFLVDLSRGGVETAEDGLTLTAVYQNVDGVTIGTKVLLAGIQVGKVTDIDYVPNGHRASLTMRVREGFALPHDSVAMIVSAGMLGGKYIKLEPGGDERVLKDGDQFEYVQGAVIFEELLQKVVLDAEARRERAREAAEKGGETKPEAESKPNPFGSLLK